MRESIHTAPAPVALVSGATVLHYYWPSEFPIALCGTVSSLESIPATPDTGVVCRACYDISNQTGHSRKNPHRD